MKPLSIFALFLLFACTPQRTKLYEIVVITPWKGSEPITNVYVVKDTIGYRAMFPNSVVTIKEIQP